MLPNIAIDSNAAAQQQRWRVDAAGAGHHQRCFEHALDPGSVLAKIGHHTLGLLLPGMLSMPSMV